MNKAQLLAMSLLLIGCARGVSPEDVQTAIAQSAPTAVAPVEVTRIVEVTRETIVIVTATPSATPVFTSMPALTPTATGDPLFAPHGDGNYLVGVDIAPGLWRTEPGFSDRCYWGRLDRSQNTLGNDFGQSGGALQIRPTDFEVTLKNCGAVIFLEP